ncbi:MAG TPA: RHS repeat-associated core domain-containing protein [Clostridia bacterium]
MSKFSYSFPQSHKILTPRASAISTDEKSGLYYLRARYMDTSTGTFITSDPYSGSIGNPMSLNKYLYANGSPVNFTDPTGYDSLGELMTSMSLESVINSIADLSFVGLRSLALNMAKNAITGSVIGGAIGGIDGALSGEGFFKGFMNGSITGAEMGALFTIREFGPLLIAMGRISGVEGVIDALRKGNYKLAAFRATVLIASEYVPDKVKDNRVENGVEPKAIENPKESNGNSNSNGGNGEVNGRTTGKGILHAYSPESLGQRDAHFSVETIGEKTLHTHQIIINKETKLTTMVDTIDSPLPEPTESLEFDLNDINTAQALQKARIKNPLGRYDGINNSCLTNACDILRAGGANIPENGLGLVRWARKIFNQK